MNSLLLFSLLVVLTLLFIFGGIYSRLQRSNTLQQRLKDVPLMGDAVRSDQAIKRGISRRVAGLSVLARVEQRLIAADSPLSATEFVGLQLILGIVGTLIGWLLSGQLVVGLLLGTVGVYAPNVHLRNKQVKRLRLFGEQLPDMLSLIVAALQAGYGILHACNIVKEEMPDPISTEFDRVLQEVALGYSLEQALRNMLERVQDNDLELVVTAITIQNETGGSLAAILETISETIRERVKLKGDVRVMTSQQRLTGLILSLLPFGVALFLFLINTDYMMGLFSSPAMMIVPVFATLSIVFGNIVMRSVTQIEV